MTSTTTRYAVVDVNDQIIRKILEKFNNNYGANSNDRRKAIETVLAKKSVKINKNSMKHFEIWINKGTSGSVPDYIIEKLLFIEDCYYQIFYDDCPCGKEDGYETYEEAEEDIGMIPTELLDRPAPHSDQFKIFCINQNGDKINF